MVVEDHRPKKGMAPRLKPQFNPLFFPFATCLPDFSIPQDYDLKAGQDATLKAYSQASLMGRELNDNQDKPELSLLGSSTIDTMSNDSTQSKLTSPWPDQWRLKGLNDDTTDYEDPWPDLEGTNAWDNTSGTEELDRTNDDAPYATPWGLFGELHWIAEPDNAIQTEPEEDPYPLTLHHPDKDHKSKLEEELPPQTSNNMTNQKETLSLRNDQCNKEILDRRNPADESQGSTSDDEEGTKDTSHQWTHQESMRPTSDDEEGTMEAKYQLAYRQVEHSVLNDRKGTATVEPTPLDTRAPNQEAPAIDNATRGRNPHYTHEIISHPGMTRPRLTQPQNTAHQPERERSMMPLLQTSAHYPKTSKQSDRNSGTRSGGTLSASSIQEHADGAKTSLSAMTHGTDADRSKTPPSTDRESKKHATPPKANEAGTDQTQTSSDRNQKQTALTTLGIIILAILTVAQKEQRRGNMTDPPTTVSSTEKQRRQTMRNAECPTCRHWTQEEPQYKNPPENATSSPSQPTDPPPTSTTPNNTPAISPCQPPSPIPPLQLRSEDSGSKGKLTTIPGKATTNSTHGGATTTAAIPGTVARRWVATKITLRLKTITATHGTHAQQWEAARVAPQMTSITHHMPPITTQISKNAPETVSPHPGISQLDKNTQNSTTSSPISSANTSPITPQSECWGNVSLPTTSCASASTSAWTAQHNGSLEKSKLSTSTTQTWRNYSTTWNGTYVPKPSLTHSTKAAVSKSPIPLSMNRGPKSSGPCPVNGNAEVNDTDQQRQPSTYVSGRKPPLSTCSYSKTTGLLPQPSTTCSRNSISHNPRTPSGGKYFDRTTLYITRSSTSRDTHTRLKGSTLDTWKHPPKKGMNVASGHHFSILSLPLASHHLTDYLNYHLTRAPDLVPLDWGARDHSHDPMTDYSILTIDCSCDQACDLSHDTM